MTTASVVGAIADSDACPIDELLMIITPGFFEGFVVPQRVVVNSCPAVSAVPTTSSSSIGKADLLVRVFLRTI